MSTSISIKKVIRKWWMKVTAPPELVRFRGQYYVLIAETKAVTAIPVKFTGVLGWDTDYSEPCRYFSNWAIAKQKTVEARFYIDFME